MSQRNRLATAALALSAALFLASPAPCRAGGLGPEQITAAGLLERFLGWIHELWPGGDSAPQDQAWEKEGSAIGPDGQPRTAAAQKEGAMINPNGQPGAATAPSAPSALGDPQ